MPLSTKPIIIHLAWLAASMIVSILISFLLLGAMLGTIFGIAALDISFNDTYFVITAPYVIVLPLFIWLTFLTFTIKESLKKFSRSFPNSIILISGIFMIIMIALLSRSMLNLMMLTGGATIYPPLSIVKGGTPQPIDNTPLIDRIEYIALTIQVVVVLVLMRVSYKWGVSRRMVSA